MKKLYLLFASIFLMSTPVFGYKLVVSNPLDPNNPKKSSFYFTLTFCYSLGCSTPIILVSKEGTTKETSIAINSATLKPGTSMTFDAQNNYFTIQTAAIEFVENVVISKDPTTGYPLLGTIIDKQSSYDILRFPLAKEKQPAALNDSNQTLEASIQSDGSVFFTILPRK